MLKDVFLKRLMFGTLLLIVVMLTAGILYLRHLEAERDREVAETKARVEALKPPPPGETHDTGHWHGDEWHAEPHSQNNTSEKSVERQTPRNVRQETGAQNATSVADGLDISNPSSDDTASSQSKKISKEAFDAWVEWENKYIELSEKLSQIGKEGVAVAPATADEWERYYSDKEYKKEVDGKRKEASDKFFEVMRLIQTHEEKRVFPPGMPTSTK